jgi:hypothetical protein
MAKAVSIQRAEARRLMTANAELTGDPLSGRPV